MKSKSKSTSIFKTRASKVLGIVVLSVAGTFIVIILIVFQIKSQIDSSLKQQDKDALSSLEKKYGQKFQLKQSTYEYLFILPAYYKATLYPDDKPNVNFVAEKELDDTPKIYNGYNDDYIQSLWDYQFERLTQVEIPSILNQSRTVTTSSIITLSSDFSINYPAGRTVQLQEALGAGNGSVGLLYVINETSANDASYITQKTDYVEIYNYFRTLGFTNPDVLYELHTTDGKKLTCEIRGIHNNDISIDNLTDCFKE